MRYGHVLHGTASIAAIDYVRTTEQDRSQVPENEEIISVIEP